MPKCQTHRQVATLQNRIPKGCRHLSQPHPTVNKNIKQAVRALWHEAPTLRHTHCPRAQKQMLHLLQRQWIKLRRATVATPSLLAVEHSRTAISPRLATRSFVGRLEASEILARLLVPVDGGSSALPLAELCLRRELNIAAGETSDAVGFRKKLAR